MPTFNKGDMRYPYRWTAKPSDNPKFRKGPDYRNFNRTQGYEVLFLINNYLKLRRLKSTSSGQKAEQLIKEKLPSRIFTHQEIYEWLTENWQ
jgi:hypothetical protein